MDFKKFLLENDVVIDNEYLDKYVELIVRNINTPREKYKTDSHHIIPRAYFKLNGLECDNSKENKVNLYRDEHMLAHLYLSKCATKTYEYTLTLPINRLMAKYNNGENTEIETFIKEHQEEINEAKEKISKLQSNKLKGHSYLTKEGRERKSEFSKKLRTEKNNLGKKGLVYNGVYMFVPISEVDDYIEKGAVLGR